jgi:hypothetical protein
VWKLVARTTLGHGLALRWFGRPYDVVVTSGWNARGLYPVERLFPRRKRYLVLLEFIPVMQRPWEDLYGAGWRGRLRSVFERHVVAPVLQRSLISAHVLTTWEGRRNADAFGISPERMRFIPWPRLFEHVAHAPDEDRRVGVMASGRVACDWQAVFSIARGQPWRLTVVCSRADLPEVERLNSDHRAVVHCEIPTEEHQRLIESAQVYLLALKEAEASSGQIRIMNAVTAGTPIVASLTRGIADYIQPGRTALTFEPGDTAAARDAVNRLLHNPELRSTIRTAALEAAQGDTLAAYVERIGELIAEADAVATAAQP